MKYFVFVVLSVIYGMGADKFRETIYLDAFGEHKVSLGQMSQIKGDIKLIYSTPVAKTLYYQKDKLVIQTDTNKTYMYAQHPQLLVVPSIIKAISKNSFDDLEVIFDIIKTSTQIKLVAKQSTKKHIEKIIIDYESKKFKKFEIYMRNHDRIMIEIL